MRKNPLIYWGVLILSGAALLWLGAVVLGRLKDIFPWIGGFGVLMIIIGVFLEIKKNRESEQTEESVH